MSRFRIILLAALAAWTLFLPGGCVVPDAPAPDGEAIVFSAGSNLLQEDATKAEFDNGSTVLVYGQHHDGARNTLIFDAVPLTKSAGSWSYITQETLPRYWSWESAADYYDFFAVYPTNLPNSDPVPTVRLATLGDLAIGTPFAFTQVGDDYDPEEGKYDLLCAAYRRKGTDQNLTETVPLHLCHMFCEVQLVVKNVSARSFYFNAFSFQHLVSSATARAGIDAQGNPEYTWINTERDARIVKGESLDNDGALLATNGTYSSGWIRLIPGALNVASDGSGNTDLMAKLLLSFTPAKINPSDPQPATINQSLALREVERTSDGTPITSWQVGTRYVYNIDIRIDGSVVITVVTTPWEIIDAHTPGLMI